MESFILQFNPIAQALIATLFTWGLTAAGAAIVFFTKTVNPKLMAGMMGFAAGAMIPITLHNIPEGLAVGVAFGAVAANLSSATIGGAIALAIGIGIQNFPEGAAVSLPLRREGMGRTRSFLMGQSSGLVEPIAGVFGAAFVLHMQNILPYALCFAAGAMIFVVVEELIPESQRQEANIDFVTIATLIGFSVMMILDVALG